ncbi:hypothetical protein TWF281_007542 [Arthrobotrys megalospora]
MAQLLRATPVQNLDSDTPIATKSISLKPFDTISKIDLPKLPQQNSTTSSHKGQKDSKHSAYKHKRLRTQSTNIPVNDDIVGESTNSTVDVERLTKNAVEPWPWPLVPQSKVVCESVGEILAMTPDDHAARTEVLFGPDGSPFDEGNDFIDWEDMRDDVSETVSLRYGISFHRDNPIVTRELEAIVHRYIALCWECGCEIDENGATLGQLAPVSEEEGYCEQSTADVCMVVFGCFCHDLVTTISEPRGGIRLMGKALWDSQRSKSDRGRDNAKNWQGRAQRERLNGFRELTRQFGEGSGDWETPPQEETHYKWLVPGSNEPYYLEGPDQGDIADSRYRAAMDSNSVFDLGGGYGPLGKQPLGLYKRDGGASSTQAEGATAPGTVQKVTPRDPQGLLVSGNGNVNKVK